jgi:hypothetical protein
MPHATAPGFQCVAKGTNSSAGPNRTYVSRASPTR